MPKMKIRVQTEYDNFQVTIKTILAFTYWMLTLQEILKKKNHFSFLTCKKEYALRVSNFQKTKMCLEIPS